MRIEFMTTEYIYKTCCMWQCDFGVKHFYLLIFSYPISFLVAFTLTFSACIERDVFQEEQIT